MNQRIELLREYILNKKHHTVRRSMTEIGVDTISQSYAAIGIVPEKRAALCFSTLLDLESPVILPGEKIVVTRTISEIPFIYTEEEWEQIKETHYIHERGVVCNISPDYEMILKEGLENHKAKIINRLKDKNLRLENHSFLESALICITSLQIFIGKYEKYARSIGETDTADVLKNIQYNAAGSFRDRQLLRS